MRIYVYTDDGRTVEMTEDFRVTYDTAVGSMDFGSGFLDSEEVASLKRVARVLGAEPPPYQHDRCAGCGHDRERHGNHLYGVDASGNLLGPGSDGVVAIRRVCWTDYAGAWQRSGHFYGKTQTIPGCPCERFAEESE